MRRRLRAFCKANGLTLEGERDEWQTIFDNGRWVIRQFEDEDYFLCDAMMLLEAEAYVRNRARKAAAQFIPQA